MDTQTLIQVGGRSYGRTATMEAMSRAEQEAESWPQVMLDAVVRLKPSPWYDRIGAWAWCIVVAMACKPGETPAMAASRLNQYVTAYTEREGAPPVLSALT